MINLKDLSIKNKIVALVGISTLGFLIFGFFTYDTLNAIKINSELYNEIREMEDLDRDVNPPRIYLLQVAYDCLRIEGLMEVLPEKVPERIERINKGIAAYEERHEYWKKSLDENDPVDKELREMILVKAHQPGKEFIDVVRNELIPAVQRGDRQKVRQLNNGILWDKLVPHWAALADVRKITDKHMKEHEEEATSLIQWRTFYLILIAFVILTTSLTFGLIITTLETKFVYIFYCQLELARNAY